MENAGRSPNARSPAETCQTGCFVVQICEHCDKLVEESLYDAVYGMCPDCREQFLAVRQLVEGHPNISVFEVSRRTGVSVRKVQSFAARGWFLVGEGSRESLK